MKYLMIIHRDNEQDSNLYGEVFAKIIECQPEELSDYEKKVYSEWKKDFVYGMEVVFVPLQVLEEGVVKVFTIN